MKELLLLRHAKAKTPEKGIEDKARALKKCGKVDAKNIGSWLKNQLFIPDAILSSPATRAIETVRIIYQELQTEGLVIQEDSRLYATGIKQLKNVLATCPEITKRVLLVGHNPELEEFLTYLVGKDALPKNAKVLPTAALVRLQIHSSWEDLFEQCAQLVSITYPKSLRENLEGI